MAAAACKTCTKCLQSFPLDHFLRCHNRTCHNCASCRGVPTDSLTAPFSPLPSSLPLPASTLSLAEPSALASAPTTAATAAASTPSHPTPLPPTVFLTKDSPMFHGLQQQLDNQASALSDIAASLQQLLASSRNPEPQLPQPPSSQPVAAILTSATLPAANTAGSALGASLPGESDVDHIFSWLSREVVQQVIDNALPPQDLGRLRNPDSLLVDDEHKHAVLVNSVLIKSVPSAASTSSTHHFTKLIPNVHCFAEAWTVYTCIQACATNDPNLGASLGAFLLHVIQTDRTHTWPSVASYTLTTCQRCFGHASAALWAQQDQAAWNQHLSTATSFRPPPKSATRGSANCQADTQLSGPPSKRQKGLEVCFWYNGGGCPKGNACWRPPPPQGSAQHIDGPAGPPNLSTPLLQGLARLFNSVLAALDVPSADRCLSLLLNAWSHNPGPRPNTSFAGNVFDPALQPTRHGSMQERAFVWSTLLNLYPDPVYCLIRIWYEGLQDLLAFVSQNPGCLLWKGDLEDAFRHVMTAKRNTHLLGFSYDGIHYCENALTFGGSSSLWLFNLVAEFLHWLVVACLPANWPINHYLDDTFGAVPVLHATRPPTRTHPHPGSKCPGPSALTQKDLQRLHQAQSSGYRD
ncbi:hypothetical protein NDA13_002371 [Ustilago tritici]|nr:hypothetical protein NDA13_002371 [Ustilago tritici]